MPWDRDNVVSWNHVHEVDGILGDSGALYTLGVQGNRPFRIGKERSYPALPEPPLEILPMSQMTHNWVHGHGWPERPNKADATQPSAPSERAIPGDGSHGPGGVYTDNGSTHSAKHSFRLIRLSSIEF